MRSIAWASASATFRRALASASAARIFACFWPSAWLISDCRMPSAWRMRDCFSASAVRIAARRSRSARICFSIASRMSRGGLMSLSSTRLTLAPHLWVASSRISRSLALIVSREESTWSSSISRDTINAKLREILDEATHKWGAKVSRVELKDINPPRDIRDAMEKQMRAERDRRAAILTAEAEKQSRILQAEGIRQSEINQAEGQKQAKILAAEAEANARLKVAEAEAQAIERITTAIKGTGGDPARYLIAIRYIEALKDMVTSPQSNKVIYVPYEATGVLSSLGGIREMLAGPSDKGEKRT